MNMIKSLKNVTYLKGEQWKHVKDFPNYAVSTKGRMYSFNRERLMSLTFSKSAGYYVVNLRGGTGAKEKEGTTLQQWMGRTFLYRRKGTDVVAHIDSNVENRDLSNLHWTTNSENERDKRKNGRIVGSPERKPVQSFIINTRGTKKVLKKFKTQSEGAKFYGCVPQQIYLVLQGRMNTAGQVQWEYQ
jgi:hypothetical protein